MTDRNKLVIRKLAHPPEGARQRRRKYEYASFDCELVASGLSFFKYLADLPARKKGL